jgi:hypothetical protein
MNSQDREDAFLRARDREQPAVRMTIVGGRPPGSARGLGAIPRGIEVLVKKASVDPAFKAILMEHRAAAAEVIGLVLAPEETAMLNLVPASQLQSIIANTKVDKLIMPAFLGKAAAVMLVALGASAAPAQVAAQNGARVTIQPATAPAEPATQDAPPMLVAGDRADIPATQPAPPPRDVAGLTANPTTQPTAPMVITGATADIPATQPANPPATQASQPTTLPTATLDKVNRLIVQMDAEDFKTREDGQKQLADMGLEIIPTLLEKLNSRKQSLEVSSRLEVIINGAIKPLVAQLGEKDQSQIDDAAKKLAALGPGVVPYLQKAITAAKLNYETAMRVNDVIRSLGGEAVPVQDNQVRARRGLRAL